MPDLYFLRNLALFIYPIYSIFIYRNWKFNKLTTIIAWILIVFLLWTIPWNNYYKKPGMIKRAVEIYCESKKKQKKINYIPMNIIPKGYANNHPLLTYFGEDYHPGNITFRVLIWEDMVSELLSNKAWFGMGLSHPLRSTQLEKLNWAYSEWSRDGWIAAHNSYLYIIYRTGILGAISIVWLFWAYLGCIDTFFHRRDITGLILCLCLFYWFLRAFSMCQFELPYYAIPMWVLIGLMFNRRDYDKV